MGVGWILRRGYLHMKKRIADYKFMLGKIVEVWAMNITSSTSQIKIKILKASFSKVGLKYKIPATPRVARKPKHSIIQRQS
ncbi:hypothetical protein HSHS1_00540 [Helicobacter suis HS1]|uniref:Uncharacterized protein n=1 Tax=Helicobacter suis TaxID=104628 RepID=A0A6J4CVG7_9HELI|nr:hypothetical protein SNTW_00510 [Helicobacter suis]BDR27293.1 hypothetical protein HSHS1_00540 [Helicobacter suis HS1]